MTLDGNWIDLVIILILFYYALEGVRTGFWQVLTDFLTFLGSILISLRVYKFVSDFLKLNFNLADIFANAFGFIMTAIFFEAVLSYILVMLLTKLPKKLLKNKFNKYLAIIPALGEGLIVIAFLLTVILALPLHPGVKKDVTESKIGGYIIKQTSVVERSINKIFGGAFNDALTYLTVEPKTRTSVPIKSGESKLTVDEASESQMFAMVNNERSKQGLAPLTWTPSIVPVARNHAKDMWERHYFSHYSPEGHDVGDRLNASGIAYSFAGENLAMAPTVQTAMNGLMNSEGHRANILEPGFTKIGIGVIDNGVYGKIFVQVFTD